jgi:putative membrane protein
MQGLLARGSRATAPAPGFAAVGRRYAARVNGDHAAVESSASRWVVAGTSVLLCLALAVVLYALPGRDGAEHSPLLPTVNAALNTSAAVCLVVGYLLIRRGRRQAHRIAMLTALVFSGLFLVTYVVHHAQVGSVEFRGHGAVRAVYFSVLLPHILGAMAIVPLVLLTVARAFTERFPAHRRIARVTLPLWLLVSVSGVVVYALLYHWPV